MSQSTVNNFKGAIMMTMRITLSLVFTISGKVDRRLDGHNGLLSSLTHLYGRTTFFNVFQDDFLIDE